MMAFDPEKYTHEADRAALKALRAIPGFPALTKAFMSVWNERQQKILNMSSRIRISENQMRKYYDMLPPICAKLGIPVPELYLEMNVVPNAYTSGDTSPFIVLTSGLLKAVPEELIPTVLAHECGHIACRHVLYLTMGRILLQGAGSVLSSAIPLGGLLTVPLQVALYYWMRCSEFSADRAAVLCDGNERKMQEVCMRLAGWDKEIDADVSIEAFLDQAANYRDMINESKWNKALEFMIMSQASHPLMAVRATECRNWCQSDGYRALIGILPGPEHRLTAPQRLTGGTGSWSADTAGSASRTPGTQYPLQRVSVSVPGEYAPQPPQPGDPDDTAAYGHTSTQSDALIRIFPVKPEEAACSDTQEAIIRKARGRLTAEEGLIAAECGTTAHGKKYAYSLIKSRLKQRYVEYKLTLDLEDSGSATAVRGSFRETGVPGFRETIIKSQMKRRLQANDDTALEAVWSKDPYDPSISEGLLMNESEKAVYDTRFPLHPLTEARRFIAEIISRN